MMGSRAQSKTFEAENDCIADESLVQMITDITGVLAATPVWAPQALARAISQQHSPEIPPQAAMGATHTRMRKRANAGNAEGQMDNSSCN